MIDGQFAYAFTVGMVATVNPCGFAMLPAYLSFFLGEAPPGSTRPGSFMTRKSAMGDKAGAASCRSSILVRIRMKSISYRWSSRLMRMQLLRRKYLTQCSEPL